MRRKFILWVDDIQNWVEILSANLHLVADEKEIDLIVFPQLNGDNIKQIAMMHQFDLILMDYQMKPYNGDKYINDIRGWDDFDNVPIIFYSANPDLDLDSMVANYKNVHSANRKNVEDLIKKFLFS